jgi:hypothetical protein
MYWEKFDVTIFIIDLKAARLNLPKSHIHASDVEP